MSKSHRHFLLATTAALSTFIFPVVAHADILYVTNYGAGNIGKIASNGSVSLFATTGAVHPFGLAFDNSANLAVAYIDTSSVEKFTPAGAGSLFSTSGLINPTGIAFGSGGNLYASNSANATIDKITSGGGSSSIFASSTGSATANPEGLAFDPQGNLYVANESNGQLNTIRKFSPTGVDLGNFAGPAQGLLVPRGLAFDTAGDLFVSNWGFNTILKFTATGGVLSNSPTVFASTGINGPIGLAFDSNGNLYVANFLGNSIEKFSSSGTDLGTFASSGLNEPAFIAVTNDAGQPLALPAPEPSSWLMLGMGIPALMSVRRMRRRLA